MYAYKLVFLYFENIMSRIIKNKSSKSEINEKSSEKLSDKSGKKSDEKYSEKKRPKLKKNQQYIGKNKKYRFVKQLGSGAFGKVFLGKNMRSKQLVAIKEEDTDGLLPKIMLEYKIYHRLQKQLNFGVPEVYDYLCDTDQKDTETDKLHCKHYLVYELLDQNLDQLLEKNHHRFDLQTVIKLALHGIVLLKQLHNIGYAHRDIKPANFMIGVNQGNNDMSQMLYLIDYGLAKKWPKVSVVSRKKRSMVGTARYASINAHLGVTDLCQRDDLLSFGYMLVYFLLGKLPWQGIKNNNNDNDKNKNRRKPNSDKQKQQHLDQILMLKLQYKDTLCNNLPREFSRYFEYCFSLKYGQKPDYLYLRQLFVKLRERNRLEKTFNWQD